MKRHPGTRKHGLIRQIIDLLSCAFKRDAKGLESKSLAGQSQGKQRPANDGQGCQYAVLAFVKLREKNVVWLSVGTEEINSVFNCQLCRGLKKARKLNASLKTNTNCRSRDLECILDSSMVLKTCKCWASPWLAGTRLV
jgi:hypothetical protein